MCLGAGKKAHFYYTMGTMVEEVVVSLSDPPQRPNSIGAALQDALPMDIIIDQVTYGIVHARLFATNYPLH